MANRLVEPQQFYARTAGLMYIITMALGIFSVNFVLTDLIIPGDNAATITNITAHESIFRVGVAGELMMYLLVILLAFSLYIVLKSVDKNLAMLAFLWRMAEAIIGGALTVLSGLLPVWLVQNGSAFESGELESLVNMFLDLRASGLDVVLIFIGMGGTIFCYLFYKSGYIPKILATWGILTYVVMFVLSFTSVITPISDATKMAFYAPGGLFELLLGLWLLIKGVNLQKAPKN